MGYIACINCVRMNNFQVGEEKVVME
jgi:hypothetical protein